ncbi:hypothetical protein BH18THE2_BH18THE2_41490 [soil metagenome]
MKSLSQEKRNIYDLKVLMIWRVLNKSHVKILQMSELLLTMLATIMLFPTTMLTTMTYGQLPSTDYVDTNATVCDSQKGSSLVSGLGSIISAEVSVECATNNMIILVFGEVASELGWNAIEYFKTKGNFTLDDITTSGMGSQGNPTRFYALLSK